MPSPDSKDELERLGQWAMNADLFFDLDLRSVRAYTCLKSIGVTTLRDLRQVRLSELKKIKGTGKKTIKEIAAFAYAHGYELEEE